MACLGERRGLNGRAFPCLARLKLTHSPELVSHLLWQKRGIRKVRGPGHHGAGFWRDGALPDKRCRGERGGSSYVSELSVGRPNSALQTSEAR